MTTDVVPTSGEEDPDEEAGFEGIPRGLGPGDTFTMTFNIPKAPLPPGYDGRIVFHYTSHQGALGIVSTHSLWATSIRSLNDGSESLRGREVIRDCWEKRKRHYPEPFRSSIAAMLDRAEAFLDEARVYVLCASERADDLGQFRNYGDVALALRTDVALNLRSDPIPFPHTLYWVSTGYGWRKVIYAKRAQEAAARALIDGFARELERHGRTKDPGAPNDIISITMCWWYASLVPLIKHSAFAQEREVRLVRIATGGFTEPSHRVSYLGIVPYVPLEHVAEKDDDHRLPLIGAHLGPIHHPEPAELGLRSLLNTHGYTDATVTRTATPFRG